MIGEWAMEVWRQGELSRIGEINVISTLLLLEKISRKVSSLSDIGYFVTQFNNSTIDLLENKEVFAPILF